MKKTLLILGNGADLHLGYKTRWDDYWEWRRAQIFKDILRVTSEKEIKSILKKVLDSLRSDTYYSAFDKDHLKVESNINTENRAYIEEIQNYVLNNLPDELELISKKSIETCQNIIVACFFKASLFSNKSTSSTLCVTEYDVIFAWLGILPSLSDSVVNKEELALWKDIESCIDSMITANNCGDLEGHEFYGVEALESTILNIVKAEDTVSDDFIKFYILSYIFISNGHIACQISKGTSIFEKTFKSYIEHVLNNNSLLKQRMSGLIEKLGAYANSTQIDILDFNYEFIADVVFGNNISLNVSHIFQPHGNIKHGVIIGGNYDLDENVKRRRLLAKLAGKPESEQIITLSEAQKSKSLAKRYRTHFLDYRSASDVSFRVPYFVDLDEYDEVMIYGWSVNEIDKILFQNSSEFKGDVTAFIHLGADDFQGACDRLAKFLPAATVITMYSDIVLD